MSYWKYAFSVSGLGNIRALFLPSAADDATARADLRSGAKNNPRMQVHALYRIDCLLDELGDGTDYERLSVVSGRAGDFPYLATGKDGKDLREMFFAANSPGAALTAARKLGWTKIRLYQCEEISR
jgi:hypothetical protein